MKLLIIVGLLSIHVVDFVIGDPLSTVIANELLRVANEVTGYKTRFSIPKHKKEETFRSGQKVTGNPEVSTTSGSVIGSTLPECHAFYSIPYGIAPVGELRKDLVGSMKTDFMALKADLCLPNLLAKRFQPPQSYTSIKQLNVSVPNYVRCYEFNKDCRDEDECDKNYSEDCLVLNINVPSTIDLSSPPSERLPVMFWLHGGAFFAGAGTMKEYDSRWLSNTTNTVIVTINYRLDALGFLNYEENGESIDGNQGFKDQQLALQWVQDNIEKFGGDKNKVTIFGNSAGAQSVMLHLVSDKSDKFFIRSIMESNPSAFYYPTKHEAMLKTEALLKAINCTGSSFQCLRDASPRSLMTAHLRVMASQTLNFFNVIEPYRPILDEVEFTEQPLELFRSGRWQNHKEVIIGNMAEEVSYVNVIFEDVTIGETLFKALTSFVVGPEFASAVAEEYMKLAPQFPGPRYDYTDILAQEISDMIFVCPSRALARFMSATASNIQDPPIYLYIDSHPMNGSNCENISRYCGYAFHGSETYFVFNAGANTGYIFTEDDNAVADMFSNFWSYFAYNGKPSKDAFVWPMYKESSLDTIPPWTNVRIKAPESITEQDYRTDLCDFWDSLNFYIDVTSPGESTSINIQSGIPSSTASQQDATPDDEVIMTTDGAAALFSLQRVVIFVIAVVVMVGIFKI